MTITGGGNKPRQRVKALLFDLDDTLYREPGLSQQCKAGIKRYMVESLGYCEVSAADKATELYLKYGTTLAGLQATGHEVISYDDWHARVHYKNIDYDNLLHPDPDLRELLCSMPLPKYVFTNADKVHAGICLEKLGIADIFQGVHHFESLMEDARAAGISNPEHPVVCKPMIESYELVLRHLGLEANEVLFADDSVRNIAAAHKVGMLTVLVGHETVLPESMADFAMKDLHSLRQVLPELFDQPGLVQDVHKTHETMLAVAN